MIRARRLFLLPAVSFILLFPLMFVFGAGIVIWLIILSGWYGRNHSDIELYFRGIKYRPGEYSKKDKNLKIHDSPEEPQYNQAEELR